jgi:hypothetical protein
MTRIIDGEVMVLDCPTCGNSSPHFIFRGDTDMATVCLASLTSKAENEIVVVEVESSEWDDESGQMLEARINTTMVRNDLRFVRLLQVEQVAYPTQLTFQEFRKVYCPARLTYSCPKCSDGRAVPARSLTPVEYVREGGKLTLADGLKLRD